MYNIIMDGIKFEWDENKNKINKAKHGIAFEEARKATKNETKTYNEYAGGSDHER